MLFDDGPISDYPNENGKENKEKVLSQSEIDALLAQFAGGSDPVPANDNPVNEKPSSQPAADDSRINDDAVISQDEIEALLRSDSEED